MSPRRLHSEGHLVSRIGSLRAAVLGANDGIVSTASLIVGVASASAASSDVLIAGVAGLVAGAMSMAAGEYVSVSWQSDTEQADLARESAELASQPEPEREVLARIYIDRGVEPPLARGITEQLMAKDALGAQASDALAISRVTPARPIRAAVASAASFAIGVAMPPSALMAGVSIASTLFLAPAGGDRRAGGRGRNRPAGPPCDLLGRTGDGADGGDRRPIRNGGLT